MVTSASAVSDVSGFAEVGWVVGVGAGANTMEARVVGIDTVTFTATGALAAYDVEIRFITAPTAGQRAAFDSAEAKWERILYGNLPSQPTGILPPGWCGGSEPAINNETVDDLRIYADFTMMDGPGGILGRAGWCFTRAGSLLPHLGVMFFDIDDVAALELAGELDEVILHEMGHVLGVGTIWDALGFLELPSDTAPALPLDTHFDGPLAITAFNDLGGSSYALNKVPVHNVGGLGSLNSHWRDSVLVTELMTAALNSGVPNPLSKLTAASMADLGYQSNYAASDTYVLPVAPFAAAAFMAGTGRQMVDDVWRGPLYIVDASGRIERVIRPR